MAKIKKIGNGLTRNGLDWTDNDINMLKHLASINYETEGIAALLERSVNAIYNKASELNISLLPKDKE